MISQFNLIGLDFEFKESINGTLHILCACKINFNTGKSSRIWLESASHSDICSFLKFGDQDVVVAYYAQAELNCMCQLGIPLPSNLIDLYIEFRNKTNSNNNSTYGSGLLDALKYFNILGIEKSQKEVMRSLILNNEKWSPSEQAEIINYCESDVIALKKLLPFLVSGKCETNSALFRGQSLIALFSISKNGVPVCEKIYQQLVVNRVQITSRLKDKANELIHIYENGVFKYSLIHRYIAENFPTWPKLSSGKYDLTDDVFKEQSLKSPLISELREIRRIISTLRKLNLKLNSDWRNTADLCPFKSKTGRNQPKADFIYTLPSALRSIIKPVEGTALIEIDFEQQEFAIAAVLSGDREMISAYQSGDPYIASAIKAEGLPLDSTKKTHPEIREIYKQVVIANLYGMGAETFSKKIGKTIIETISIQKGYKKTYSNFWDWQREVVSKAIYDQKIKTKFGWEMKACQPRYFGHNPSFKLRGNIHSQAPLLIFQ